MTPIADERCALAPAGCDVAVHEVSGRVEAPWQRVVRIGGVSATRHVAAPARAARRPPRPPGGRSRARPGTTRALYQGGSRDWDRAAVHADAARGAARRAGASRWRPRGPRLPARAARSSGRRWRAAPPTASGGGAVPGRPHHHWLWVALRAISVLTSAPLSQGGEGPADATATPPPGVRLHVLHPREPLRGPSLDFHPGKVRAWYQDGLETARREAEAAAVPLEPELQHDVSR